MVPFLDLKPVYQELRAELDAAVARVLAGGWYLLGEELAAFEREFAAYVGARHCVGLGNGLDALHLGLRALGIGPGDEVIVPSHTFVATWLAVSYAGATPVPVEPTPGGFQLDAARLAAALSPRTKAIVPVHLYGAPADVEAIGAFAAAHGLAVLEDAAQAHGARLRGRRIGSHGHTAAWSFYPGKNLGALGDGGALTTDDDAVAARVRRLRSYGSARKYVHEEAGFNSRLDELQAAVLRVKLPHLEAWNARRVRLAARYQAELAASGLELPPTPADEEPVWHLYVVRSRERDRLAARLAERGVGTIIHYPTPAHLQPAYAHLGLAGRLPEAERLANQVLSLPMGPHVDEDQAARVIDAVLTAAS